MLKRCGRALKAIWVGLVFAVFSTTVNLALRYYMFPHLLWPIENKLLLSHVLVDWLAFVFLAYELLAYQYRKNARTRHSDVVDGNFRS